MICPPCASCADIDTGPGAAGSIAAGFGPGHPATVCRDHGKTPSGCGCQHRPPLQAPKEEPRA